jgi:hypothetical protein
MALQVTQTVNRPGILTVFTAADAGGDTFTNTGREILQIKNGDVSAKDATIVTTQKIDSDALDVQDLAVLQVPASGTVTVGPFVPTTYGTTVSITYSAVTSVSIAVLKVTS